MKIVCDSCSAKYSIADEKVAGKVFKIRCKKCSAVIVVRGDQLGQDSAAIAEEAGDPSAIWHVVVNGDQQGPFAPHQIGEMLTAGTVDWEAYIWREGFEEWMAARDVPELVEAVTGQPQDGQHYSSAPPAAAELAAGGDAFGSPDPFAQPAAADPFAAPAAEASPFAATAPADDGGMFGGAQEARAHAEAGGDLFAQAGASPFDSGADDDVVVSAASPRVSEEQASMTGQRNENSVLFSLQNLQALATGSSAGGTSSPPQASPQAGMASGEGSGLIDIRALASAAATPMGASSMSAPRSNVDDLISIGTGSPLGGSLGAPVLAPVQEEKSKKGMFIGIAAAFGVIALAAVAVIVILLMKEPDTVAQADTAGGAITPGQVPPGTTAGEGTPAGAEGIQENTTAENSAGTDTENAATDQATEEATPTGQPLTARERRDRDRARAAAAMNQASSAMDPGMAPAAAPSMAQQSPSNSSLDSLLDMALGGMGGATPTMTPSMEAASASLPDTPSRDQVSRALRSVSGAVRGCGGGQHGSATVRVNVSGSSGRVTSAQVIGGPFAGTPAGSCIARAVRGARFPRFSRSSFSVAFPYSL